MRVGGESSDAAGGEVGGEARHAGHGDAEAGSAHVMRVGVSSCLLGLEVRFDGGHKRARFVTDELARFVEFVPVCPEVESGMPIPRPTVRLVREGDEIRLREVQSGSDHTDSMRAFSQRRVESLRAAGLCGYILKKDSPSCGAMRVKVYSEAGMPRRDGMGMFAEALARAFPNLPIEEEGRLNDAPLRENFIERIFAHHRMRAHFDRAWTSAEMVAFHTAHKLQVMAHSPQGYRELGRLVAGHADMDRGEFERAYCTGFMESLRCLATPGRHTNVLQHAAGFLKKHLDAASRAELVEVFEDYRLGLIPLSVPITLLRHHVRVHRIGYLAGQVYLEPHPKELMLRNHV